MGIIRRIVLQFDKKSKYGIDFLFIGVYYRVYK